MDSFWKIVIIVGILCAVGVTILIHDMYYSSKAIWQDSPCSTLKSMHNDWKEVNEASIIDYMWLREVMFENLIKERGC